MRYLSLDLETTGLDPETCQILEIAAVLEDTAKALPVVDLPYFHRYIYHDEIHGQLQGLAMNARLIEALAARRGKDSDTVYPSHLFSQLQAFCLGHGLKRVALAGKNVAGFDVPFLRRLPGQWDALFDRRVIDPAILFWQPETDSVLPSMGECSRRAGLVGNVTHRALNDAWDVVLLVRNGMADLMRGKAVAR